MAQQNELMVRNRLFHNFAKDVVNNLGKTDEPTWRCPQNPFIGALGIQEPVIPGEPLIKRQPMARSFHLPTRFQTHLCDHMLFPLVKEMIAMTGYPTV